MDKAVMKMLFRARGLRVPDWVVAARATGGPTRAATCPRSRRARLPPLREPANLGSSVGISKVHYATELPAALTLATEFDRKIIVERAVPDAREIECAVLGNEDARGLMPGEIVPSREFYDYEAKYIDGRSRVEIPAALDDKTAREIQRLAVAAFQAIDGTGLARVDFLLSRSTRRVVRERDQHATRASRRSACTRSSGPRAASTTARSSSASSRSRSRVIRRSRSSRRARFDLATCTFSLTSFLRRP